MLRNQFRWFKTDVSLLLIRSKRVVRYQNVSKHANWYANKCISDRRVAGALLRRIVYGKLSKLGEQHPIVQYA